MYEASRIEFSFDCESCLKVNFILQRYRGTTNFQDKRLKTENFSQTIFSELLIYNKASFFRRFQTVFTSIEFNLKLIKHLILKIKKL